MRPAAAGSAGATAAGSPAGVAAGSSTSPAGGAWVWSPSSPSPRSPWPAATGRPAPACAAPCCRSILRSALLPACQLRCRLIHGAPRPQISPVPRACMRAWPGTGCSARWPGRPL